MRSVNCYLVLILCSLLASISTLAQNPKVIRDIVQNESWQDLNIHQVTSVDPFGYIIEATEGDDPQQLYMLNANSGLRKFTLPGADLENQELQLWSLNRNDDSDLIGFHFISPTALYFYSFETQGYILVWEQVDTSTLIKKGDYAYDPSTSQAIYANGNNNTVVQLDQSGWLVPGDDELIKVTPRPDALPGSRVQFAFAGELYEALLDFEPTQEQVYAHNDNFFTYNPIAHRVERYRPASLLAVSYKTLIEGETFGHFFFKNRLYFNSLRPNTKEQRIYYNSTSNFSYLLTTINENSTFIPSSDFDYFGELTSDSFHIYAQSNSSTYMLQHTVIRPAGASLIGWDVFNFYNSFLYYFAFDNGIGEIAFKKDDTTESIVIDSFDALPIKSPSFFTNNFNRIFISDFDQNVLSFDVQGQSWETLWDASGHNVESVDLLTLPFLTTRTAISIQTAVDRLQFVIDVDDTLYQLSDMQAHNGSANPFTAQTDGTRWYFWANASTDYQDKTSLYVSDGTTTGTTRLYDHCLPTNNPFYFYNAEDLHVYNSRAYGICETGENQYTIIGTDGTLPGTSQVASFTSSNRYWNFLQDWLVLRENSSHFEFISLTSSASFNLNLSSGTTSFMTPSTIFLKTSTGALDARVNLDTQEVEQLSDLGFIFPETASNHYEGDFLYSIANNEIRIANLSTLEWVTTIPMQNPNAARGFFRLVYADANQLMFVDSYNANLSLWQVDLHKQTFRQIRSGDGGFPQRFSKVFAVEGGWVFASRSYHDFFWTNFEDFYRLYFVPADEQAPYQLIAETTNAFIVGDGRQVFFTDHVEGSGEELWVTNGYRNGTHVVDIAVGAASSSPRNFALSGSQLFFTAYKPGSGREPMLYCATPNTEIQAESNVCAANSLGLQVANAGPGATYTWRVINGNINSGQGSAHINITPTTTLAVEVEVSVITPNGCTANGQKTINVTSTQPQAPTVITGDPEVCQTASFSTNVATASAYDWQASEGVLILSGQRTDEVVIEMTAPSGWLEVAALNGCGQSEALRIDLTNANVVDAGPDQSLCGTTSAQLSASTATGTWQILSGTGGQLTDANDPNAILTGQTSEFYVLEWTTTNACGDLSDRLLIRMGEENVLSEMDDILLCATTSVNLEATLPAGAVGTWSVLSGENGRFSNTSSPTTRFTGVRDERYLVEWRVATVDCGELVETFEILINGMTSFYQTDAGQNQDLPTGQAAQLNAVKLNQSNGMWHIIEAPSNALPSFSDPTDPLATFDPGSDLAGAFLLEWEESVPGCREVRDRVEITYRTSMATASLIDEVSTAETQSNFTFAEDGVYYISKVSFDSLFLNRYDPETGTHTALVEVAEFRAPLLYNIGNILILEYENQGTGVSTFSYFDKISSTLSSWFTPSFRVQTHEHTSDFLLIQTIDGELNMVEADGTFTFESADQFNGMETGFITGDQYIFREWRGRTFTFNLISKELTELLPSISSLNGFLIFSEEGTLLDNHLIAMNNYDFDSYRIVSIPLDDPENWFMLESFAFSGDGFTIGSRYFWVPLFAEDGPPLLSTDGTHPLREDRSWQGFADNPNLPIPYQNGLLTNYGTLTWLDEDGASIHPYPPGIVLNPDRFEYLSDDEALFSTQTNSNDDIHLDLYHLGNNIDQFYNVRFTTQSETILDYGVAGNHLLVITSQASQTPGEVIYRTYAFPFAPFAAQGLEVLTEGCFAEEQDVALNDGLADQIEWQVINGEYNQTGDDAMITVQSEVTTTYARAYYQDGNGEWVNASARLGSEDLSNFAEWDGRKTTNVSVMDLIEQINACFQP